MIKLYLLMTLVTGSQAYTDVPGFSTQEQCNKAAEEFVDNRMATGRYDRIEAFCGPSLGVVA